MSRTFHTESIRFKAGKILGSLVNLSKDVIQLPFTGHRILHRDHFLLCEELSAHERLESNGVEKPGSVISLCLTRRSYNLHLIIRHEAATETVA